MTTLNPSTPCSRHFKFADLIHCGETYQKTQVANIPKDPNTVAAIEQMARTILDPVVDQFGEIKLTYGFCSNELLKQIKRQPKPGIAPQLDQHAGFELNSRNTPICKRPGFACDFYAVNTDSLMLAKWIINHLTFDRLYYYGKNRPIHISVAPNMLGAITLLQNHPSGRNIPRNITKQDFLKY
ncbi:hypothetical protein Q9L42_012660 [Methylomarinum sp. Ch1-1]|uniref:Peptidase M15A C-terminal domain-containing protein n=1 Tax=Methylomarinum roseum TaxID=3067653 RepID=A0AAU7NQI3_9GAMM|nr:hypothetical protein [Methylomarinum sp. Ch1-1]MDP4520838.1 hypothetical protein [Methylomarinum sp. Ch1-1]